MNSILSQGIEPPTDPERFNVAPSRPADRDYRARSVEVVAPEVLPFGNMQTEPTARANEAEDWAVPD
ncbi:hypothetical protein ACWIGN_32990, partial [Streptomyces albidoflavus]